MRTVFKLFNFLFRFSFPLYKILYFTYKRINDHEIIILMRKNIGRNSVILDIGANIGFYSSFFSKCTGPGGLVISFEPDKTNFAKLSRITKNKKNIQSVNCAVSNSNLDIDLFLSSDLNVDHHTYDDGESRKSVKVKSVSIDSFLEQNFPDLMVDFIKMDLQGFDLIAFRGMINTIKKSNKMIILGECWPYGLEKANSNMLDYYTELQKSGFQVNFIPEMKLNDILKKSSDRDFYSNFIACKNCDAN